MNRTRRKVRFIPGYCLGFLSATILASGQSLAPVRAVEATALFRRVVEEVDIPLFAFDPEHVLRLVNSAGERLLQLPAVRLLGRDAQEIGLKDLLTTGDTLIAFPANVSQTRWLVRRSSFRQNGVPPYSGRSVRRQPRP